MKELRLLKANEIDVRIGTINEKGATLLLYKDARVDMNILDESGVKWQRRHDLINGNLFCTISIWDEEIKQWIERQDVGVESNTEKEKGQASDAFKRAGFNFGIGRELYTAPFTWISADNYDSFKNVNTGKLATYDKFTVDSIGYDENKEINQLVIKNVKSGKIVFKLGSPLPVTKVIRNRTEEAKTGPEKRGGDTVAELKSRKEVLNEDMIKLLDLTRPDQRLAFVRRVLQKETIDTLEDTDLVSDAIDNERSEPGINTDGTYNK